MKQILLFMLMLITLSATAQTVTIPDANFKAYLVGNTTINTNGDSEIQTSEAAAFTGGIYCDNQNIASLEGIEAFTALTSLVCAFNDLTNIDIRQITALSELDCAFNDLGSLDLSQNTALTSFQCSYNDLVSLDLSANTTLTQMTCNDNQLTSLNIANGNNTNIFYFNSTGNASLTCIQVDDVTWSDTNWTNKDATASYSTNCNLGIEDFSTEVSVSLYPNPASTQLRLSSNKTIESMALLDVTGKVVAEPNTNNNTIDIAYLNKGLYFLQINTPSGSVVKKFVKN